jgi:hypothetical protein
MFGIPTPESLAAKALCAAAGALILLGAGAYGGYRWELGKYEQLVAADATAQTKAVEHAREQERHIAAGNQADAVAQAYFKGKMDAQTVNLVLGVPSNVTFAQDNAAATAVSAGCVTYGFIRVLAAGERGVPAESLDLPGGESVDSCTAVKPSDLAAAVAQDLAAGTSNGHQLDSLIGAVKRINREILSDAVKPYEQSQHLAETLPGIPADMGEPNHVGDSDGQAGPPGQRQAHNDIEPQVIDAPRAEKGGWQPVNAGQSLALADRAHVEDLEAGRAQLKTSLGDIRVKIQLMAPDL